jgi:hypothetical protein
VGNRRGLVSAKGDASAEGALVPRLKSIELNGEPEPIATVFVGGLKHRPIRYQLR